MRMAFTAVVLLAIAEAGSAECITVLFDVRRADVVAVARYAGERTFTVESILRAVVQPPSKITAPEDWRPSQCAPPEPVGGQTYLVALHRTGYVQYRDLDKTAAERSLIDRLHPVVSRSILEVLERYVRGDMTAGETEDWLSTAVVTTRSEYSFSRELLETAESLIGEMRYAEACHEVAIETIRTTKLREALRVIERSVPPVDTEEEFVRDYLDAIKDPERRAAAKDDEAVEAFDEITGTIRAAFPPLEDEVKRLPRCDPKTAVKREDARP